MVWATKYPVSGYLDPSGFGACCRYGYPVKHPLAEQFGMVLLQPLRPGIGQSNSGFMRMCTYMYIHTSLCAYI